MIKFARRKPLANLDSVAESKAHTLDARSPKSYADETGTVGGGSTEKVLTARVAVTSNNNVSSYESLPDIDRAER